MTTLGTTGALSFYNQCARRPVGRSADRNVRWPQRQHGRRRHVGGAAGKDGFLKGYYDRLQPGPEGGAKMCWIKPGSDFDRYNYVMLDSVVYFFADDSEYKGIEASELKKLTDDLNKALVDTLKGEYPIATEPGADVLRIRFAITDLKQSYPGLSAITTVVPVGLSISILKKGAT